MSGFVPTCHSTPSTPRSRPPARRRGCASSACSAEAELTVSELVAILGQSQPRISRHLQLLVEAGLVERHREGAWAFFRLAEPGGRAGARAGCAVSIRPIRS